MFLGFNHNCKGWKEERKIELLDKITEETKLPYFGNCDVREIGKGPLGKTPYLQLDSFGESGVYIRKVTKMTEEDKMGLQNICEDIYKEVMINEKTDRTFHFKIRYQDTDNIFHYYGSTKKIDLSKVEEDIFNDVNILTDNWEGIPKDYWVNPVVVYKDESKVLTKECVDDLEYDDFLGLIIKDLFEPIKDRVNSVNNTIRTPYYYEPKGVK